MPIIPAFRELQHKNINFEASQDYKTLFNKTNSHSFPPVLGTHPKASIMLSICYITELPHLPLPVVHKEKAQMTVHFHLSTQEGVVVWIPPRPKQCLSWIFVLVTRRSGGILLPHMIGRVQGPGQQEHASERRADVEREEQREEGSAEAHKRP